jgi:hypothetical protein
MVFYDAKVAMILTVFFAMNAAKEHVHCRLPEVWCRREDTWSSLCTLFRARRWKHSAKPGKLWQKCQNHPQLVKLGYELACLRDDDTGKGYCPACAKDHLDWNAGVGVPHPAPTKVVASVIDRARLPDLPPGSDPPGRLRELSRRGKKGGRGALPFLPAHSL